MGPNLVHCYCVIDLDTLVGVLRTRSDMWYSLASALRVPQEQLKVIEGYCHSDFDSLVEVCDAWLNMMKDKNISPAWEDVISALHETGEKELTEEIESGASFESKNCNWRWCRSPLVQYFLEVSLLQCVLIT